MSSHCDTCGNWIRLRKTIYGDGSEVINWQAVGDNGDCRVLGIERPHDFGCSSHYPDEADHAVIARKDGAPWQNYEYRPCPSCGGRGSLPNDKFACLQCAGTARVRFYDDGYIGDEQTRKHPREAPPPPPVCRNEDCGKPLDMKWSHCPWCGFKTDKPAPTEVIDVNF